MNQGETPQGAGQSAPPVAPPGKFPPGFVPVSAFREIPIPISGSAWPSIKAAFPMSEEAWKQMIAVLNAMKPGLVVQGTPDTEEDEGQ